MAIELHIELESAEAGPARGADRPCPSRQLARGAASHWIRRTAALMAQWAVVFGLISSGYFGAAAINAGVEFARRSKAVPLIDQASAQILAATSGGNYAIPD